MQSFRILECSRERPLFAPEALEACSRWLSGATPPVEFQSHVAPRTGYRSQSSASTVSNSTKGIFGDIDALVPAPLQGAPWMVALVSGGVAPLNHRLQSGSASGAPAWEGQRFDTKGGVGRERPHLAGLCSVGFPVLAGEQIRTPEARKMRALRSEAKPWAGESVPLRDKRDHRKLFSEAGSTARPLSLSCCTQ